MTKRSSKTFCGFKKFSRISTALYELHWLPVSLRIYYKILLLTFKRISGLAPTYLSDPDSKNRIHHIILGLLLSSSSVFEGKCLQHWEPDHFQQQLRNYGMAYLWSFVKQHQLTVLNLDLRLAFLTSVFFLNL